jgi:alkylation response protein AidB-like acyl-CoA dehydrogenase
VNDAHLALHDAAARWVREREVLTEARACLDADAPGLPSYWAELADLGWLGLHVPESAGGSGFGLAELGVVLEELGRACAPGPFLPSVLAAAVLTRMGTKRHADLLQALATGDKVGAVAFGPPGSPVLGAQLADVIVVPVVPPERAEPPTTQWAVVDASAAPLASVDRTRRVGRIDAVFPSGAGSDPDALLGPEPFPGWVETVGALLLAAESLGGAAWCTDTAAAWARERVQFGRPIGQFQGVKHRCADMLCRVELARAAVWDGLRAADELAAADGGPGGQRGSGGSDAAAAAAADGSSGGGTGTGSEQIAMVAAAALGPEAFFRCAKDAVQILGGIGFTWEHDAHIFLKRAAADRLLAGPPSQWDRRAAALAAAGARRSLRLDPDDIADPAAAEAARAEVREFVAAIAERPKEEWRAALVEHRYLAPHWAEPWGRSATPLEQLVIDEELRAAHVRRPNIGIAGWVLPTLLAHGTTEQQERWVRPTLLGEISWCQLFSEPGAGSDLASVTTRATKVDGGWRIDGQKVWTTFAHVADFGLCVARTDPDVPKHAGLTTFVVDVRAGGVDIRPLRELTGIEMFNEVFLDGVFVPDDAVVGAVNDGWRTARTTLENERVAMGSGSSFGPGVESLVARFGSEPEAAEQVGELVVEAHALATLGMRMTLRALAGHGHGPEASVRKLLGVEHDQRVQEVGMLLGGPESASAEGDAAAWVGGFLANRCLTIAGGTSEIQRNVIAERLLGLPRDP